MASKFQQTLSAIAERCTPSQEDRKHVDALAKRIQRRLEKKAQEKEAEVEVRLEGSVAKNTWLRESPDIDIFMRVPPTTPLQAFKTLYLEIAREAVEEAEQTERFADHPYLEAKLEEITINIVPCYRVNRGEWKSATDRTPFHTDYVKPLLNDTLCREIRLLKQFMKGLGIYGADIKTGGFSGYLCELLVLSYGSFLQALKAASEWNAKPYVDLEHHYRGREPLLQRIFHEPLVVVDPVDKGRNAASAVRRRRLDEFITGSRAFLDAPGRLFFYPPETKPFSSQMLMEEITRRGSTLVFILFEGVEVVPDILWGQLYKSKRALHKLVDRHGFEVVRASVWSNEQGFNVFVLETLHRHLPRLKSHLGPPLQKRAECIKFLQKHQNSGRTLSGPRAEEGRWVVETTREHTDIVELLKANLRDGGKRLGVADFVGGALAEGLEILTNEAILPTYQRKEDFAKYLTAYLKGKPSWLI